MQLAQRVEAGLDTSRLERITEHLEENFIRPGKIVGCQTLVARHGQVAHFSSLGEMDRERGTPMREDTIFRIYSMTKPITSVALMTLYERGLFQLNDPVSRVLPEWRDQRVWVSGEGEQMVTRAPERPVTFRHVLSHTAGLTYGGGLPGVGGALVERLSGRRFDEYLREAIFEPLGMVDTAFSVAPEKVDRFAANYQRRPDKTLVLVDDPQSSTYLREPTFFSGGGGLTGTTADYLRFCEMLRRGGELDGARVLGPRTIKLMTKNHLAGGRDLTQMALGAFSETANEGVGFGLGFAMTLSDVEAGGLGEGDYYWGGAASTIFWVDPREDMVAIFMTQLMPSGSFNFRGQLKSIIYSSIVE